MTQVIIYANGTKDVSIPVGESIAIAAFEGKAKIYLGTPSANFPDVFALSQEIENEEVSLGTYSSVQSIRIDAGAGKVLYDIGASPTISESTSTVEGSVNPLAVNGFDGPTVGTAGGVVALTSGSSPVSTAAVAGGVSGNITITTPAGAANTGGATGQVGGDGGAIIVTGGAGGATNSAGAHAGGAGSDVLLYAGAGGAASAGTGNGGAGGTILITPGAGGATTGGTAGVGGVIISKGLHMINQGAATAATTSATLTAAEVLAGIITLNQGASGATAQQLPLATAMDTALPDTFTGDAFDFSVVNISTDAGEDGSITTNTGWTLVGNMDIASNAAATDKSAGRFRAAKTAAGAWTLFRLS